MKIIEAVAKQISRWCWEDTILTIVWVTISCVCWLVLNVGSLYMFADHSIQNYYMHTGCNTTGITYTIYGERYYHEDTKAFISTDIIKTTDMLHTLQETLK